MKQLTTQKRFLRMGTSAGLMLVLGALLAMGISAVVSAHGGDPSLIHSCANESSGRVRIAPTPDFECPPGWSALDWDTAGLTDDDWTRDGLGSMYTTNLGDNVGIGTSGPGFRLHVVGSDLGPVAYFRNSQSPGEGLQISMAAQDTPMALRLTTTNAAGVTSGARIDYDGTKTPGVRLRAASIAGFLTDTTTGDDGALSFQTRSGATLSERMRIHGNGNVGIGTTDPQSALQVTGYVQLDLTVDTPPTSDCDETTERGRMKVDSVAGTIYVCVDSGWVSK